MYKLIIFDLDGTLLDTVDDITNSVNYALSQFNFPTHSKETIRSFIGNGLTKLIERSLPVDQCNNDYISMVRHEFMKHYAIYSETLTIPYAGVENLLEKLQSMGYLQAIASNKVHSATQTLAKKYFGSINFCQVFGQREGVPVKPNPEVLYEIMQTAGVIKSETLYVGDSGVDAQTARNAGVDFVGVLWGLRPKSELLDNGATVFIEQACELLEILKSQ